MKITILVEGKTETAFKPVLIGFLKPRLIGRMPRLDFFPYHGRLAKEHALGSKVTTVLMGRDPSDHVIALTDVYTGGDDFTTADDAKQKMRDWVGHEPRFTPHVALHDFEAWLLPYWDEIQRLSGSNRGAPGADPEKVNHGKPPAHRIHEMFRIGSSSKDYVKARDGARILHGKDLSLAIAQCGELKAFVNTILRVAGGSEIA